MRSIKRASKQSAHSKKPALNKVYTNKVRTQPKLALFIFGAKIQIQTDFVIFETFLSHLQTLRKWGAALPNFGKQPNFESHTKDFEWEKAYILQVDIYLLKICLRKDLQNKLKKNRFPMGLSTKYTIWWKYRQKSPREFFARAVKNNDLWLYWFLG